ncbi:MAG: phytanoyl-CoA dioxygenase family protein [Gemmatimonadetes bacterium]|nr:phytanoyl-CoA dioxygenase family protein [Gemmatimonadota bacterium]MYF17979.1 phytanoyl-CoA dioxygenase family protein [Gemmatimonadota bacterium]
MTLEEKFIFDLQGYIVVKNVLSQAEVDELNAIADQKMADQEEVNNGLKIPRRVSLWGKPFQNLFDHPNMIPYLSELLGPQFRADHDYGIFMRQGGRKGGLHGGDHRAGTHYYKYRDGVMRNGLTVVVYFLAPAPPGSGGFCCVPGSHKSNFALNVPEDVRSFKRIPHYLANPSAETGDALIFTEATMHGTLPWTAENERRTLLYKFTPGHASYASIYYNHEDYEDLTEQQKRVLTPPSVRRPNVVETA